MLNYSASITGTKKESDQSSLYAKIPSHLLCFLMWHSFICAEQYKIVL